MSRFQFARFVLAGIAVITIALLVALNPGTMQTAWATNSPLRSPLKNETQSCWTINENKSISIATTQWGVGWWDKEDELTVVQQKNQVVIIPKEAVMISIPLNCRGMSAPAGWMKMMRENGEWVIVKK